VVVSWVHHISTYVVRVDCTRGSLHLLVLGRLRRVGQANPRGPSGRQLQLCDVLPQAKGRQASAAVLRKGTCWFGAMIPLCGVQLVPSVCDLLSPRSTAPSRVLTQSFVAPKTTLIECVCVCNQALEIDGNHFKTIYRRGQAYLALGELLQAKQGAFVCCRNVDESDLI